MAKFIALEGVDGVPLQVNVDQIAFARQYHDYSTIAFSAGKDDTFLLASVKERADHIVALASEETRPISDP